MTSPETLEATQVAEHHSVVRSCPQSWHDGATALSSWNMAFWPIWWRYGTTWGRRISSMYRRPFKFPGTTTRAVLPFKLILAHIITLPPLYAVVGWTVGSKCLSPLRRHTRMRPSTFRRQNLDSSEKRTRDHYRLFHLPCRAQNWRLRARWRWESWGFLAGFLELNPEVSYWYEWGVQHQTFFWPRPLGPWGGGQKVKYHLTGITVRFLGDMYVNVMMRLKRGSRSCCKWITSTKLMLLIYSPPLQERHTNLYRKCMKCCLILAL